jgi:hypothetical protein
MKPLKLLLTADLGVTNTTDAYSCGLRLSYSTQLILAWTHWSFKLLRNKTNGTTIIVTPVEYDAGNINAMLLPAPVPITIIIGLF